MDSGHWICRRDGVVVTSDMLTVNPCSVNVSLGNIALKKKFDFSYGGSINLHKPETLIWEREEFKWLDVGPNDFYLAHVRERFDCAAPLSISGQERYFAPMIEGRSTPARCGLSVHETAGFGDHGFNGNFTLEISAKMSIILHPGDEIAQIVFMEVSSGSEGYQSVYSDQYDEPRAPVLGKGRFQRWD